MRTSAHMYKQKQKLFVCTCTLCCVPVDIIRLDFKYIKIKMQEFFLLVCIPSYQHWYKSRVVYIYSYYFIFLLFFLYAFKNNIWNKNNKKLRVLDEWREKLFRKLYCDVRVELN